MPMLLIAVIVSLVAIAPAIPSLRFLSLAALAIIFPVTYGMLYVFLPGTVGPIFGNTGLLVIFWWVVLGFCLAPFRQNATISYGLSIALAIASYIGIWIGYSPMLSPEPYARMIGTIETRQWTSDIQPKNPQEMRLVSPETAQYIARKAVAQAGSVGSQFNPDFGYMTIQRNKGRIIYAVPLDYNGYAVWTSTEGSPGWIEIDGQDPEVAPRFVKSPDGPMKYMPGAYLDKHLKRILRERGSNEDFAQHMFVIDDEGKPHWMIVGTEPTMGYNLDRIRAVYDVDPVTGKQTAYAEDKVPAYVDLVLPKSLVTERINAHGEYAGGWWNAFWVKANIEGSDSITLVSGNDNQMLWVSGISQPHRNSDALVAMIYTDARTGKNVRYETPGGATDEGLIRAVDHNSDVQFKKLQASMPQIYNVDGIMTAMLPVRNQIGAYQGVAFVDVANPQDVAYGATEQAALTSYKMLMMRRGQQISLDTKHGFVDVTGIIERIAAAPLENRLIEFKLIGDGRIFAASANDYVGLSLAKAGDSVALRTVDSEGTVLPIQTFVNQSLDLHRPAGDIAVEQKALTQQNADIAAKTAREAKIEMDRISPDLLKKVLEQIVHLDKTSKTNGPGRTAPISEDDLKKVLEQFIRLDKPAQ